MYGRSLADAFSMVSNPIQSPICCSCKVNLLKLAIPSIKAKMAAKSSSNLISVLSAADFSSKVV